MPETKDAPVLDAPPAKPSKIEERIYNLLHTLTPAIGKKFVEVGALKITESDILAIAEKNADIMTDSSGNVTVMALLQSIVFIATGKRLKGMRHPTQGVFTGFKFETPTVIESKRKIPTAKG